MQPLSHSGSNLYNNAAFIQRLNKPVTAGGSDGGFAFSEEKNKDLKSLKTREYLDELQRQVREKQLMKQREKEEQERMDRKIAMEAASNNPFGRAGGGAPLKDKEGNVLADLSQVRAEPEQYSPLGGAVAAGPPGLMGGGLSSTNNRSSEMLAFIKSNGQSSAPFGSGGVLVGGYDSSRNKPAQPMLTNGVGEPSYARGGNGIFGEAKTEEQLKKEDRYKAELQKQVSS